MTAAPLVSVIIPVWNGARFLPEALASIQVQNYTPLEILVIDDGSTDETAQIATRSEYNIRYLAFPHRGLVPTRLAGITAARGEFIAFLDVDDLWSATKLQTQLALLRENPNLMIVNGYTQLMRLVHANAETMRFENWGEPVLAPSFGSALFRLPILEQLDLLNGAQNPRHDLDWFMPARERAVPMLIHSDVVQYYRRHSNNMSNENSRDKRVVLQMLKDSLVRRSKLGLEGVSLPPLNQQMKKDSV